MSNVFITASGPVGSGKSAVLGEIEIALRAIGVPVRYAIENDARDEKNLTGADWQSELELTKPSVVLVEQLGNDRSQARKAVSEALADWWLTHDPNEPPSPTLVDEIMGALTFAKIIHALNAHKVD